MNRYFRIAREICLESKNKMMFGAVLVFHSGLFIAACNHHEKTHPILRRHYSSFAVTSHAEMRCITLYNQYVRGPIPSKAVMFVYREDKTGAQKGAKPCDGCIRYLRSAGLKRVKYSTRGGYGDLKL